MANIFSLCKLSFSQVILTHKYTSICYKYVFTLLTCISIVPYRTVVWRDFTACAIYTRLHSLINRTTDLPRENELDEHFTLIAISSTGDIRQSDTVCSQSGGVAVFFVKGPSSDFEFVYHSTVRVLGLPVKKN